MDFGDNFGDDPWFDSWGNYRAYTGYDDNALPEQGHYGYGAYGGGGFDDHFSGMEDIFRDHDRRALTPTSSIGDLRNAFAATNLGEREPGPSRANQPRRRVGNERLRDVHADQEARVDPRVQYANNMRQGTHRYGQYEQDYYDSRGRTGRNRRFDTGDEPEERPRDLRRRQRRREYDDYYYDDEDEDDYYYGSRNALGRGGGNAGQLTGNRSNSWIWTTGSYQGMGPVGYGNYGVTNARITSFDGTGWPRRGWSNSWVYGGNAHSGYGMQGNPYAGYGGGFQGYGNGYVGCGGGSAGWY